MFHRLPPLLTRGPNRPAPSWPAVRLPHRLQQHGLSLLELLVAITLGVMVMAAALGTLLMSRAVTSTTGEVASLQQDAAYALTVMGRLIRQAGALEPVQESPFAGLPMLAFEDRAVPIVTGRQGGGNESDSLTVATQSGSRVGVNVDCFGNTVSAREFSAVFAVNDSQQLTCQTVVDGKALAAAQPLVTNVSKLQVRYRIAQRDAAGRDSLLMASEPPPGSTLVGAPRVVAVELCLEMEGSERLQGVVGSWTNCAGESVELQQRLRRVFRNVFYLRSA